MHDITPSGPFSEPWPDHLTPPNGESEPPRAVVLIHNIPVSTSRARRFWRAASLVQLKAARPYGRRLASAIISCSVRKGLMSATGPNGSSFMMAALVGISDNTVGA